MGASWDAPSSSLSKMGRDQEEIELWSAFTPASAFPKRHIHLAWLTNHYQRILFSILDGAPISKHRVVGWVLRVVSLDNLT